jgi:DNA-binding beta-propeller fold protein YncE
MRRIIAVLIAWTFLASGSLQADVVVTGFAESSIRTYAEPNGQPGTPIIPPNGGVGSGFVAPGGMTYGPDGFLYVSCQVSVFSTGAPDFVMRVNPNTGAFSPFITLPTGYVPAGLRFGPDGDLYVARNGGQSAGSGTGRIDRYNGVSGALVGTVVGNLTQPTGVEFRGNDLFISNFGAGNVVRFDGANATVFTTGGSLAAPSGLTFGPDGKLYVADLLVGAVLRYDGITGAFDSSFIPAGGALLNQFPADLLFDRFDRLLVANLGASFDPGDPPNLHGNVMSFNAQTGAFLGTFAPDILGASALALTPIPEPGSLALAALGALALRAGRRWR